MPEQVGADQLPQSTADTGTPAPQPSSGNEELVKAIRSVLPDVLGLKPGQNISHVAYKASESAVKGLEEKIAALANKFEQQRPTPAQPAPVEQNNEALTSLAKDVQNLKKERDEAVAKSAEQQRINLIQQVLSTKPIDPSARGAISTLITNGLEGAKKPYVGQDGQLYVETDNGAQPFDNYANDYLAQNAPWSLTKPLATKGAGGKGSTPSAMASASPAAPIVRGSMVAKEANIATAGQQGGEEALKAYTEQLHKSTVRRLR